MVGTAEDSLDLVENVSREGATLVNYFYLADGTKTRALDGSGEGLVYRGPFVYRKGSGSSSLTLESAAFGGGRLTPDGALLYMTDYLGSVRAVVDGTTGQIYKAVDYSAYGAESDVMVPQQGSTPEHALAAAALPSGMTLRDSFTGQEDQSPDFGTSYTDFGARQYSPALRRWMTPDPLSEKYYGMSPYVFCADNPVNFVDPDGEAWETAWDILNVIYDAGAAVYNHVKKDHDRAREHWKNAAYDGLAAVVPGLPAGFSKLRHVDEAADAIGTFAKAANAADNAADAAKAAASVSDGKVYVTYTKVNPKTGEVYSGRASGYGTPKEVVANRDRNHHMNEKGFEKAKLDRFSTNSDAIRGREQQLIELNGGAKSQGGSSGNAINGVSLTNPNKQRYEDARRKEFGH